MKKDVLNQLIAEEGTLKEQLAVIQNRIRELKIEIFIEETGLNVGDKVAFKDGRQDKTGEIVDIIVNSWGVSPVVFFHKKDGTVGKIKKDWWFSGLPTKIV